MIFTILKTKTCPITLKSIDHSYQSITLITPGEIFRFPRRPISDFWRGIASCKISREVTSKGGVGMCKVTFGVAWRPVSHMRVHVSDLWRCMVFRKSLTSVS